MKKLFYVLFGAVMLTACHDDEDAYVLKTLTFEDADYNGSKTNYWTSLVDSPQYGGTLLYGSAANSYVWEDVRNTNILFDGITGEYQYASGGEAISNYVEADLTKADYTIQLAVPTKNASTGFGGHNGSKNFCVHYGAVNNATQNIDKLQYLSFGDGVARVIDHMYIAPTTYLLGVEKNGNSYASALGSTGWLKVVAYGVNASGKQTGKSEFYLYQNGKAITDWTKWDLSGLGKVLKIAFNVEGSDSSSYGLNTPGYFAYDDIAVRFEE